MKGLSFSGAMIKPWMARRKPVTRRLMNPQPGEGAYPHHDEAGTVAFANPCSFHKPRYLPGEIVYIKETWRETWCSGSPAKGYEVGIEYRATWTGSHDPQGRTVKVPEMHYGYKITKKGTGAWKSPRFMPFRASRSTALVLDVRPEQLKEMTEPEAIHEGFSSLSEFADYWKILYGTYLPETWIWRIHLEKQ